LEEKKGATLGAGLLNPSKLATDGLRSGGTPWKGVAVSLLLLAASPPTEEPASDARHAVFARK